MSARQNQGDKLEGDKQKRANRPSKKEQIISLFLSGMGEVEDVAIITGSRPSYVASVLQEAGLASGYFDLYTSSAHPMNVYSKFFAGKLGFKDEETARSSVELIDRLHSQFEFAGDRAGQHHALIMALTMFDRARFTGKAQEAEIFRQWLIDNLTTASLSLDDTLEMRAPDFEEEETP
ncbi:MAG TPA: hypothetical protein VM934_06410 [Pyrinomonadaceae bacterium]|jgi:hypothetical protein|nr:hypothetical protein [Pyrinomonadaceae bacterium]